MKTRMLMRTLALGTVLVACSLPSLTMSAAQANSSASTSGCDKAQINALSKAQNKLSVPAACFAVGEVIRVGNHSVPTPRAGFAVGSHLLAEDSNQSSELVVGNTESEIVINLGAAVDGAKIVLAATAPSACSDGALSWQGVRNNGWGYYFNSSTLPSGISLNMLDTQLQLAVTNISKGANRCGLTTGTGLFDINITRLGSTFQSAMTSTGGCMSDSLDIVDVGTLPSGILGLTCDWRVFLPFADDVIYAADVRLSSTASWFTSVPASCVNSYDLASVFLHELGHVMGLGHVDETTHGRLVMSTAATRCSAVDRTWGLGDYNSLVAHY